MPIFFFFDANFLEALLEDGPPTQLEKSLVDLLKSNVLPSDDKIAVGTIRRCECFPRIGVMRHRREFFCFLGVSRVEGLLFHRR